MKLHVDLIGSTVFEKHLSPPVEVRSYALGNKSESCENKLIKSNVFVLSVVRPSKTDYEVRRVALT